MDEQIKRYVAECKAYSEQSACYITEMQDLVQTIVGAVQTNQEETVALHAENIFHHQEGLNKVHVLVQNVKDLLSNFDSEIINLTYENILFDNGITV